MAQGNPSRARAGVNRPEVDLDLLQRRLTGLEAVATFELATTADPVGLAGAASPLPGYVLTATSPKTADWLPAGGITDGSRGDVVVSGSGAVWSLAAGSVSTTRILDGAITESKLLDGAVTLRKLAVDETDLVPELQRKFRLLLKHLLVVGFPPPPGLEDEYELALATE